MEAQKVNQYMLKNGRAYVKLKSGWVQTVLDKELLGLFKKCKNKIVDLENRTIYYSL